MMRLDINILVLVTVLAIVGIVVVVGVVSASRRGGSRSDGAYRERHRSRASTSPLAWGVAAVLGLFAILVAGALFWSAGRRESALRQETQVSQRYDLAREREAVRSSAGNQTALPAPSRSPPESGVVERRASSQASSTPLATDAARSRVSTGAPSPPPAPLPIRAGPIASLQDLEVPDPFERWRVDGELVQRRDPALLSAQDSKPWLTNAGGSVAFSTRVGPSVPVSGRRPGSSDELVGYSTWEPDAETAIQEARRSAAEQVRSLAMIDAFGSDPVGASSESVLLAALQRVEPELEKRVITSTLDQYSEELSTEYGALHRAAVLIRVAEPEVRELSTRLREATAGVRVERSEKQEKLLVAIASALGLALVVFLLYSFVNAGTKGYFAWPLRLLSIGTLIALYLALMYLQGWIPR